MSPPREMGVGPRRGMVDILWNEGKEEWAGAYKALGMSENDNLHRAMLGSDKFGPVTEIGQFIDRKHSV